MASSKRRSKTAKKTTKKKTTSKAKKTSSVVDAPEPGHVNIPLTHDELETLITLLSSSVDAYTLLANRTAALGDVDASNVLASRAELCNIFVKHLNIHLNIDEPNSRLKH